MSELKFKSAERSYGEGPKMATDKWYPRFSIDLEKFNGLRAEPGKTIELTIKARVAAIRETEACKEQDMEILSIGVPKNAADETYANLTSPRGR